jgi:hypothetical protein
MAGMDKGDDFVSIVAFTVIMLFLSSIRDRLKRIEKKLDDLKKPPISN